MGNSILTTKLPQFARNFEAYKTLGLMNEEYIKDRNYVLELSKERIKQVRNQILSKKGIKKF